MDERRDLETVDVVWKDIEAVNVGNGVLGWVNDAVVEIWRVAWLVSRKTVGLHACNGAKCV